MADFEEKYSKFESKDVEIIGASVDDLSKAQKMVDDLNLSFSVGWGLDAKKFSDLTGAFYEGEKGFLHATGFILRPNSTLAYAVYSSGSIGRFVPDDCIRLIDFLTKK